MDGKWDFTPMDLLFVIFVVAMVVLGVWKLIELIF